MKDIYTTVLGLRRPPLLVRAARFGIDDYHRETHLRRVLRQEALPGHGQALMQLMDVEREHEAKRKGRNGDYTVAHHVEVLIAIMAEAALFRATRKTGADA